MTHFVIHSIFDLLSVAMALLAGVLTYKFFLSSDLEQTASKLNPYYFLFLFLGSVGGAYLFGTLNLWVSGLAGVGRSVLGSLAGATFCVELYKILFDRHRQHSTGYIYVIPFCVMVSIGRIGCFLSGIEDLTYGTPTDLPWGHDFGDGFLRHPVPIYESLSMAFFVVGLLFILRLKRSVFVEYAYYAMVFFYCLQRYVWEFFKPYSSVFLGQNVFQLLCLALIGYSLFMLERRYRARNRT